MEVLETRIESTQDGLFHYGKFYFSKIKKGQGITLANSLRRVLLYDLSGFGITHARFQVLNQKNDAGVGGEGRADNLLSLSNFHEFSSIPGIRESVFEFLLNLRSIVWRVPFAEQEEGNRQLTSQIYTFSWKEIRNQNEASPGLISPSDVFILRAKHLKQKFDGKEGTPGVPLSNNQVFPDIVNPEQYLATIMLAHCPDFDIQYKLGTDSKISDMVEINSTFEGGGGYTPKASRELSKLGSWLPTEGNFFPVKRVNYSIEDNSDFSESVFIEIWTNGAVEPKNALLSGFNILLELFQEAKIG